MFSQVPVLHCTSAEETLAFWRTLGFAVTCDMRKPYLYLALRFSGFELHYGAAPSTVDPRAQNTGGCLVLVDAVQPYHAAFTAAMRRTYGKVLSTGLPRITRYRAGASRFTIIDPSGNSIIVIQRDEPADLDYGGSRELEGLARVLDNARILREFKHDDQAAYRALNSGLRRHGDTASTVELASALAGLIDVLSALGQPDRVPGFGDRLRQVELTADERERVRAGVADPAVLDPWLPA